MHRQGQRGRSRLDRRRDAGDTGPGARSGGKGKPSGFGLRSLCIAGGLAFAGCGTPPQRPDLPPPVYETRPMPAWAPPSPEPGPLVAEPDNPIAPSQITPESALPPPEAPDCGVDAGVRG